jgi:hypothetical protein
MDNLCPFFKEKCHGNECIMWKNEKCYIVSFLQRIAEAPEEDMSSAEEGAETGRMVSRRGVPELLETSTPEELAEQMVEFAKKEFPEEKFGYSHIFHQFWESKGVQQFLLPTEAQSKIERANYLADRLIDKEKKERLAKEREELPSLVSQCVDWAKITNIKTLRLADVEVFTMEKKLNVLDETKRDIWKAANVKLRSGK